MDLHGLYRDIVETSPDGLWVFDLDGRTVFANAEMARMLGVRPDEMPAMTVFDSLDETGRAQFREHLVDVRRGRLNPHPVEVQLVARDGTLRWMLVRESGLHDERGELVAVLHRFTDYGARRAVQEELRRSQEQLAEAQRIARVGHWTWDVATDEIMGSPGLYALYGLDPDSFPVTYAAFLGIVHPEDVAGVDAEVRRALEGEDEFTFEARVRGEHDWIWTRGRGVVRRGTDGAAAWMSGTHQDITVSKQAETSLVDMVAQNALMQAVASAANESHTLLEVLSQARHLVLLHDDWERGRAFVPDGHGGVAPLHVAPEDQREDEASPEQSRRDKELAARAYRECRSVWDEQRLTIATPVVHDHQVRAVVVIASAPPLYRHQMIEQMVELVANQLARVAEREETARELASARDAAMEGSRQKSEFLATMSHEIRTPLNGVLGLNDLLLRTGLDTEQRRLAEGVSVAGRALLGVINDVLDFSKIEAGQLELERVDFDPHEVLDQLDQILGETARTTGVELRIRPDAELSSALVGDPTRLLQVLTNLVSNAVKFTEQGYVEVRVRASPTTDGRVRLAADVVDTGVGIPQDRVDGLFTPFHQTDASTTRLYGGTGLGLAICREIVEAMGGEIGYEPTPQGGSHFWFTASLEVGEAVPDRPEGSAEQQRLEPAAEASGEGDSTGRSRPRALVVEDNEINQMVAVGVLSLLGLDSDVAGDGIEALRLADASRYDVVLMDVQMPRMDGYAATRQLRRRAPHGERVPVIAMTATAVEGERERCLAAGMDWFLTKPVDPAALSAVLDQALNGAPGPAAAAGPAATEPDGGLLDLVRLAVLRDLVDGDTTYLDRAIGNFVRNSAQLVADMRSAARSGDAAGLRHASHKLLGSALNLGVTGVAEASRKVEELAEAGTVEGAGPLIEDLARAVERGIPALLDYQSSYAAAS